MKIKEYEMCFADQTFPESHKLATIRKYAPEGIRNMLRMSSPELRSSWTRTRAAIKDYLLSGLSYDGLGCIETGGALPPAWGGGKASNGSDPQPMDIGYTGWQPGGAKGPKGGKGGKSPKGGGKKGKAQQQPKGGKSGKTWDGGKGKKGGKGLHTASTAEPAMVSGRPAELFRRMSLLWKGRTQVVRLQKASEQPRQCSRQHRAFELTANYCSQ